MKQSIVRTLTAAALVLLLFSFVLAEDTAPEVFTCGDYTYVLLEDGSAEIAGWTGSDAALVIPGEMDGHPVTSVGAEAFRDRREILSVTVPEGVTVLNSSAFRDCTKMETAVLPSTLLRIEAQVFDSCHSLENVNLPEGLTFIGRHAFGMCHLRSVTVPGSVQTIDSYAFQNNRVMSEVTLCPGISILGALVFSYCTELTEIVIPDSVVSLGNYLFSDCSKLERVTLPHGAYEEGEDIFRGTLVQEHAMEAFPEPDQQAPVAGKDVEMDPLPKGTRVYTSDDSFARYLPEGVRAANPLQADYVLVREVRKYSLSNYTGPAYETETSVYLCGRDGSLVCLCRITHLPPNRGWVAKGESLEGKTATYGEIWERIGCYFPVDE
ncbi:MAG: leucine-rich repeat domain-containing protein [Clostridium sp.]|nr:leucine-rich repeat domain-containing protein [Clostridium sp.]